MPRGYKQLSGEERDRLSLLKVQGKSLREIAGLIGRDVSTVSRELKRNARPFHGDYLAHRAQERADARKAAGHERERLRKPGLKAFVRRMLRNAWSPERISGRLTLLGRESISPEAIYQWVYADSRDLIPFFARAHRRRQRFGHTKKHRSWHIPSRTPISQRPESVRLREEAGHWECDTIIGQDNASALRILVERKTRYTHLDKLPAKTAAFMRKSISRALGRYPQHLRRTITYDNGSENSQHVETNKKLGTTSYFCAPMHSWEKGSVENTVGLVRRRFPKKTDFKIVTDDQVRRTERWLNALPRKCLGFKTPTEACRESVALSG